LRYHSHARYDLRFCRLRGGTLCEREGDTLMACHGVFPVDMLMPCSSNIHHTTHRYTLFCFRQAEGAEEKERDQRESFCSARHNRERVDYLTNCLYSKIRKKKTRIWYLLFLAFLIRIVQNLTKRPTPPQICEHCNEKITRIRFFFFKQRPARA